MCPTSAHPALHVHFCVCQEVVVGRTGMGNVLGGGGGGAAAVDDRDHAERDDPQHTIRPYPFHPPPLPHVHSMWHIMKLQPPVSLCMPSSPSAFRRSTCQPCSAHLRYPHLCVHTCFSCLCRLRQVAMLMKITHTTCCTYHTCLPYLLPHHPPRAPVAQTQGTDVGQLLSGHCILHSLCLPLHILRAFPLLSPGLLSFTVCAGRIEWLC